MAWNQPGGSGNNPWGKRPAKDGRNVDEAFKNFQRKLEALVKGGGAGKSKALVKGKGANLPDPALGSLAFPVTAQLLNTSSGDCLEASYTAGNVVSSGSSVFKAKK